MSIETAQKPASMSTVWQSFSVAVVGEKEQSGGTVNVRTRDNVVHGEFSIEAVTQKFQALKDKQSQNSEVDFWTR